MGYQARLRCRGFNQFDWHGVVSALSRIGFRGSGLPKQEKADLAFATVDLLLLFHCDLIPLRVRHHACKAGRARAPPLNHLGGVYLGGAGQKSPTIGGHQHCGNTIQRGNGQDTRHIGMGVIEQLSDDDWRNSACDRHH